MPAPIVPPRQTTPTIQTAKLVKPVSQPKILPSSEPEYHPSPSSTPPPQEPAPIPFNLDERGDDSSSAISSVLNPNDVSEDAMAGKERKSTYRIIYLTNLALNYLNNTIQDFETADSNSIDSPSTPKFERQFREVPGTY